MYNRFDRIRSYLTGLILLKVLVVFYVYHIRCMMMVRSKRISANVLVLVLLYDNNNYRFECAE